MSWGILQLLGSVTLLVLTLPLAIAGVELLLGGNLFAGMGLFGIVFVIIAVDRYVTKPGDLPMLVADKVVDSITGSSDEE